MIQKFISNFFHQFFKRNVKLKFFSGSTVLKLSENWDILEDFNENHYLLNLKNGEAYEISPVISRFLSLLDGKRTLKEIIDMLAQTFPSNEIFDKDLDFFLKEGLRRGFLKKYSV